MIIQQTFKNQQSTLFLIGTPIGNLDDMSFRAIEVLKMVDVILCEDTRTSQPLLKTYGIEKPLLSLHKFNEYERKDKVLQFLKEGKNLALISDAGVPTISDPGAELVHELRWIEQSSNNISAVNVGPAYLHAVINAGFLNRTNYFHGFLQAKAPTSKTKELETLLTNHSNQIVSFYESVHRIQKTMRSLAQLAPDLQVSLNRELTKMNEEIVIGTAKEIALFLESEDFVAKGEFVVVFYSQTLSKITYSDDELLQLLQVEIDRGLKLKEATLKISQKTKVHKNYLYNLFHKN